jgi:mannose-1-phosphate guanylyltransferase/mannose-1-phosphate guanylyltransferase/mannose-6-phosphate isomerase
MNDIVYRPWGSYQDLLIQPQCRVKIIVVNPGERLSLQWHKFRSEHWVVSSGEAVVTLNGVEQSLKVNDSIFIPLQAKHRVANPSSDLPLHIIETQLGTYVGEDDIIREQDDYKRV